MRVSDGGREGGREGRKEDEGGGGADTELKTKTPHVNVGKNQCNRFVTRFQCMQSFYQTLSNLETLRLLLGFSAEIHKSLYEQSGNLNT